MEKLLVGPLKVTKTTTLIIIDALDECKDREPASAILSILSRYAHQIPTVKFFITGRPEPRIRSGFRLESLAPITEVLKLHEVKPEAVDRDIELLFRTQLTSLVKNRSDLDLTEDWPSPSDIRVLCKKAAGFFIYASTIVKFIASEVDPPTESLSLITSIPDSTVEEGKSGVDQLYAQILQQAFSGVRPGNSQRYIRFKAVVGTVLLLFNPLSIMDLSDLLGCSTQYIQNSTRSLHSLLHVPESLEEPIQIFHKSFPDFLMDPDRCENENFVVEPAACHAAILLACLRLMEKKLKRNICNLDDYVVLSKARDHSTHKKDHIGEGLEYACKFWTKHLLGIPNTGPQMKGVQKAVDNFFTVHLLHWVEVLAITGNLSAGVYAMNDVKQWYNVVSDEQCLPESILMNFQEGVISEWANDGKRFLLEHFDTIQNYPSYIYHSALPLSPSSSWLYKHYIAEVSPVVKVVKGCSARWGVCSRTTLLSSLTWTLSHHGNSVAVGSEPGDITIINVITGSQSAVLSGHTTQVACVNFSSDGTLLVSGSQDKTVKLWDIQTGGVVKTFFGHKDEVLSVSISADSTTIASGSDDGDICLWNVQTGACYHTIKQQTSVSHVMFSPTDPQHLICVYNRMVWQWDADGCQIRHPFDGSHVTFSSDGAQFVSCFREGVMVHNSSSGATVTEFQVVDDVHKCCFSPNNGLIAVAVDETAYCWDITASEPKLVDTFIGHTNFITSLVFASSTTLISASCDKSVKFWQIGAQSTDPALIDLRPLSLPSAPMKSVALQSKEGIAITYDSDDIIKTWDISTGICKTSCQTPAQGPHKWDTQLINGRLIFVWYMYKRIHVWDAENGESLWEVNIPGMGLEDIRISGDGFRVFGLYAPSIWAWSLQTGEVVGKMEIEFDGVLGSLIVDGSKVWTHWLVSNYKGWDFGIPGSAPVELPNTSIHPSCGLWNHNQARVENPATGEVVFQLSGKLANPVSVQCDDSYLVAAYRSGEMLILDLTNVK